MKAVLPLLILLAACRSDPAASPVDNAAVPGMQSAPVDATAPPPPPEPRTAEVGPLRLRYDPALLAPVDARIGVPPDWSRRADALKLVARDRAELIGKAECMYGLSGQAERCTAAKEAGLAFAFLETPFEELRGAIDDPAPREIAIAGRDRIRWEIGAEGEGADYILFPADGGTILIEHQYRTSGNPDDAAVEAVLESLAFER